MKWIKAVLCCALLAAAGSALCNDVEPETPQDYATGRMLRTFDPSQWYRVPLPLEVYYEAASADLRDVRVFNHEGEVVPFTLQKQQARAAAPDIIPLVFFPFDGTPEPLKPKEDDRHPAVLLRAKNGVEIRFESDNVQAIGQSYLLTLPKGVTSTPQLSQLRLEWDTPAENWQGKASLYYSRDFRRWVQIEGDAPLMDLTHGAERLKMDTLGADNVSLSDEGIPCLLLILDSQNPPLTLKRVSAITRHEPSYTRPVPMSAEAEKISASEAIWRWSRAQPLTSLEVTLHDDGVLPVALEWRGEENGPWRPLSRTVLFNLENQHSEAIPLSGELVQAVRMTTVHARLPDPLPTVRGGRDSYQLIFNAQGKGPYMLLWGNGAAGPASVSLDMLIPPALHNAIDVEELPQAFEGERLALGGESRLTATSAAVRHSQRKMLLVWCVLILGVLLLAGLAYRVWLEAKKGGNGG